MKIAKKLLSGLLVLCIVFGASMVAFSEGETYATTLALEVRKLTYEGGAVTGRSDVLKSTDSLEEGDVIEVTFKLSANYYYAGGGVFIAFDKNYYSPSVGGAAFTASAGNAIDSGIVKLIDHYPDATNSENFNLYEIGTVTARTNVNSSGDWPAAWKSAPNAVAPEYAAKYNYLVFTVNASSSGASGGNLRIPAVPEEVFSFELIATADISAMTVADLMIPPESRYTNGQGGNPLNKTNVIGRTASTTSTGQALTTVSNSIVYTFVPTFAAPETKTITVSNGQGGTIAPAGTEGKVYVEVGKDQEFTITPDTGYRIKTFTVDSVNKLSDLIDNQNGSWSYTVSAIAADTAVAVTYEKLSFLIDTTATGGTITPEDPTVEYGQTQGFVLTPDEGYELTSLKKDGAEVDTLPSVNLDGTYTYSYGTVTKAGSLEAVFALSAPTEYTVTINAGLNGTISPAGDAVGKLVLGSGETQEFTITPATGYHTSVFTVDGVDKIGLLADVNAASTYTLPAIAKDLTIEVAFAINTYTVTANVNGGVGGTIQASAASVNHGGSVTFTLTPDAANGYTLDKLIVDNVQVSASNAITHYTYTKSSVTGDVTATVYYKLRTFRVTATVDGGGGELTPASQYVEYGSPHTVTIKPNEGYQLKTFTVAGVSKIGELTSLTAESTYTIESVTAQTEVAATFELIPPETKDYKVNIYYMLTTGAYPAAPSQSQTYQDEVGKTVSADPADYAEEGYFYDSSRGNTSVAVAESGDASINLYFEAVQYQFVFKNGGVVVADGDDYKLYYGAQFVKPADPTGDEGSFVGWYIGDTDTSVSSMTTVPVFDGYNSGDTITLNARFSTLNFSAITDAIAGLPYYGDFYFYTDEAILLVADALGYVGLTAEEFLEVIDDAKRYSYSNMETSFANQNAVNTAAQKLLDTIDTIETSSVTDPVTGETTYWPYHAENKAKAFYKFEAFKTRTNTTMEDDDGNEYDVPIFSNPVVSLDPSAAMINERRVFIVLSLKTNFHVQGMEIPVVFDKNVFEYPSSTNKALILSGINDSLIKNYSFDPAFANCFPSDLNHAEFYPTSPIDYKNGGYADQYEVCYFNLASNSLTPYRTAAPGADYDAAEPEKFLYLTLRVRADATPGTTSTIGLDSNFLRGYSPDTNANKLYFWRNTAQHGGSSFLDTFAGAQHSIDFQNVTIAIGSSALSVTATAGAGGTIDPAGNVPVFSGETKVFTITPNSGKTINTFLVDGSDASAALINNNDGTWRYTLSNITASRIVTVTFKDKDAVKYTITTSAGTNGAIAPSGVVEVAEGSNRTFTIEPNSGYMVETVTVDGNTVPLSSLNNLGSGRYSYTFPNVNAGHTISATFVPIPVVYHTVTITKTGNGSTVPAGPNTQVAEGEPLLITLVPETGYRVSAFTVDGVDKKAQLSTDPNPYYTITAVTADMEVAVAFELIPITKYLVTATVSGGAETGTVTPTEVEVAEGGDQTFTLLPAEGYELSSLLVGSTDKTADVVNGEFTLTDVTEPTDITVTFTIKTYTVSVTPPVNGQCTATPSTVEYDGDSLITLTADTGYELDTVYINSSNAKSLFTDNGDGTYTYTITNIKANQTVTASFKLKTFTVTTAKTGSGTITDTGTVGYNGSFTVDVTPAEGYEVTEFTVDGTDMLAELGAADATGKRSYTLTNVMANASVSVTFTIKTYTLELLQAAGGAISAAPDADAAGEYDHGTEITISAVPDTGYELVKIIKDSVDASTVSPYVFDIVGDTSITAEFALIKYDYTIAVSDGGSVSIPLTGTVDYGTDLAFTLTITDPSKELDYMEVAPDENYNLANEDASDTAPTVDFEVTEIVGDIEIDIVLVTRTFAVSCTTPDATKGAIAASADMVEYGGDATFTVTPVEGYEPDSFTVNGTDAELVLQTDGTYTYEATDITEATEANVTFKKIVFDLSGAIDIVTTESDGSLSGNTGATVDLDSNNTYEYGSDIIATITAKPGFVIEKVTVDTEDAYNYDPQTGTLTVSGITQIPEITVNTTVETFSVDGIATPAAGGTVVPAADTVDYNTAAVVVITPADHYNLVSVKVIKGDTDETFTTADAELVDNGDGTYTLTYANVLEDINVEATFEREEFVITVNITGDGEVDGDGTEVASSTDIASGTDSGKKTYTVYGGESFSLVFTSGVDQYILGLELDGVTKASRVFTHTLNLENIGTNHTVDVEFAPAPPQVIMTLSGDAGSEVTGPETPIFQGDDAEFDITVATSLGYDLVSVTVSFGPNEETVYGVADLTDNSTATLTKYTLSLSDIQKNGTITAVTALRTYTVTATSTDDTLGTVSPATPSDVTHGEDAEITITPAEGKTIDKITETRDGMAEPIEYTMQEAIDAGLLVESGGSYTYTVDTVLSGTAVAVDFTDIKYTVTGVVKDYETNTVDTGGTITPPDQQVSALGDATVTFAPDTANGYYLYQVVVGSDVYDVADGLVEGQTEPFTFVIAGLSGNAEITAIFRLKSYTVSASATTAGGSIAPATQTVVHGGDGDAVKITLADGYELDTFTVGGVDASDGLVATPGEAYDFTYLPAEITGDTEIEVAFKLKQSAITATAGTGGSITPSGTVYADYFTDKTFTVNADEGYELDTFKVDGVDATLAPVAGKTDEWTYTLSNLNTEEHTVEVTFKLKTYEIIVKATPSDEIDITGDGTVEHGEEVEFAAVPKDGYEIVSLKRNGTVIPGNNDGYYQTFTAAENVTFEIELALKTYELTLTQATGGTLSATPTDIGGEYEHGTEITITADADEGYELVKITKDGEDASTDSEYKFNITADTEISAEYKLKEYNVSAAATPADKATITGVPEGGTATHGDTFNVIITAAEGYKLTEVTVNGVNATITDDSRISIPFANADLDIVATLAIRTYEIAANATPTDWADITGTGTAEHGEEVTFTATPKTGYEITSIKRNSVTISGYKDGYTDIFNATEDVTFDIELAIKQCGLSKVDPSNGTLDLNLAEGDYDYGTGVTVTATADTGYHLKAIYLNGEAVEDVNGVYSFTLTEDTEVTAEFEANTYTVSATATPADKATITGVPEGGTATYGDTFNVVITAADSHKLTKVTVNGVDATITDDSTISILFANADLAIVATLEIRTYDIIANATPTDQVDITGTGTAEHGEEVTFTATPKTGYEITSLKRNSVTISGYKDGYTETFNATEDVTFDIELTIKQCGLSKVDPSNGTLNLNLAEGDYDYGTGVTVTATADTGHHLKAIYLNGEAVEDVDGVYSFTLTEDTEVTAEFEADTYTVSATATPADKATITGVPEGGTATYGDTFNVVITAAVSHKLTKVTVNGVDATITDDSEFSIPFANKDLAIVATLEIRTYEIAANATPADQVDITGTGTVKHGDEVTFTATPKTGYEIISLKRNNVTISGCEDGYTGTFNATEDVTFDIELALKTYALTLTQATGGTLSATPTDAAGEYDHGTEITITADVDEGYELVKITKDGVEVSTAAEYKFSITADTEISAEYKLKVYTLTGTATPAEGGTVAFTQNSAAVTKAEHGTSVDVLITVNAGYRLDGVKINGVDAALETNFSSGALTGNYTVEATFVKTYTFTVKQIGNGTVSPADGTFDEGTEITITAIADTNWRLGSLTVNDAAQASGYTFNISADTTVAVEFIETFALTCDDGVNGSLGVTPSAPASGRYDSGTIITIDPQANVGWQLDTLTLNGNDLVAVEGSYFFKITEDSDVAATWKRAEYTISITEPVGGTIKVVRGVLTKGVNDVYDGDTIYHDDLLIVTATPDTANGYELVKVTKNGEDLPAPYTFRVEGDTAIDAQFKLKTYTVTATATPTDAVDIAITGTDENGEVEHGSDVTVMYTAKAGYDIIGITVNGNDQPLSDKDVATITLTGVTEDADVVATLAKTYKVTLSKDAGILLTKGTVGVTEVVEDSSYDIEFTVAEGMTFVSLKVDGVTATPTVSNGVYSYTIFNIKSAQTVVIDSTATTYNVTATATPTDAAVIETTGIDDNGKVEHGSNASVKYTAKDGYEIIKITVNGGELQITDKKTMTIPLTNITEDRVVVATLAKIEVKTFKLSIDLKAGAKGKITTDPAEGDVAIGTKVTVTATPVAGYRTSKVTVNGQELKAGADGKYTFTLNGDSVVSAEFVEIGATAAPTTTAAPGIPTHTADRYDPVVNWPNHTKAPADADDETTTKPVEDPDDVDTGSNAPVAVFAALALAGGAAIVFSRKRKDDEDEAE